ncbi:cortexin domain-containing 1 protein-like [Vanacampus margaritifer]
MDAGHRIFMDRPLVPVTRMNMDVDQGFALFFFLLLCLFLLVTIVRCVHMVLDPYSTISVNMYQEEPTQA